MLEDSRIVVHIHIREGVCSTVRAQEQRIARRVVAGIIGSSRSTHQSTIAVLRVTCRDSLRDNRRLGVFADMNHLRARIRLLIVVRHSY